MIQFHNLILPLNVVLLNPVHLECSAPQEQAGIFHGIFHCKMLETPRIQTIEMSCQELTFLKNSGERSEELADQVSDRSNAMHLFHSIFNAGWRLGVVNGFPGIEQVFPRHRKSGQSNVSGSWFTK